MAQQESKANLLIIDDDETLRNLLLIAARSRGWRPVAAATGLAGCELLDSGIKAVVLDHGLPDGDGIQILIRLREKFPNVPVIMLTGLNDAEVAVRAIKVGADDYLTKPFELERLFTVIQEACRLRQQSNDMTEVETVVSPREQKKLQRKSLSPRMLELYHQMEKAAQLDITVLLTGESGTGKTHIAREIHRLSPRAGESFIPVSCPALPRELLESELFGHEKGAFTGATAARAGRFEQASKGTIFLDEIGDLPSELQPKLLTVLQDREFFRVGGNRILCTEARIIAATNIDLQARVADGRFREDLYYRLNILELHLPPLRDRVEDLPDLLHAVIGKIANKRGVKPWSISAAALEILKNHHWPGNIRQLENVLERATAFADDSELDERDILPLIQARNVQSATIQLPNRPLHEVERLAFVNAYHQNGHNKAKTARSLGISERTVYNLLARYELK
ncbi:MAG: sigma-54-dependent Fis family transcriptional regulator [Gloeobacteraceae cyanobacterium ES-bin-144]|nr:sigma-54-dependent Fis family transcriptional regulator [Verrucomicrobiales bacterium]